MAIGVQEGDIRQHLAQGGYLRSVLVVSKNVAGGVEHLAYIWASWRRGFRPLRTWNDKAERTYRDFDRLLTLVRGDFGYRGPIALYLEGDRELARYRALAEAPEAPEPTPGLASAPPPAAAAAQPGEESSSARGRPEQS